MRLTSEQRDGLQVVRITSLQGNGHRGIVVGTIPLDGEWLTGLNAGAGRVGEGDLGIHADEGERESENGEVLHGGEGKEAKAAEGDN